MATQQELNFDLRPNDVFTPNSSPIYTYVDRADLKLEKQLQDALEIKNVAVSISGPSKSGKTVLTRKVLNPDYLIKVNGASVRNSEAVWSQVLRWMDVPESTTRQATTGTTIGGSITGKGSIGIPLLTSGEAGATANAGKTSSNSDSETYKPSGLESVISEISDSEFVIFIDDFHYIPREIQRDIGRQIKAAIENGVKICTASVPHRTDDVVRANPELRGRLVTIDIGYWSPSELELIGKKGFPELNMDISPGVITKMANESFGSPQIMQSLCLNLSFVKDIKVKLTDLVRINVSDADVREIFRRTSAFSDWSSLLSEIHSGPRQRGTERKVFDLTDQSSGDVYRAVLLALTQDPAKLSLRYDEILSRVKSVCKGESPAGSSINAALEQIAKLSKDINDGNPVIEWDEDVMDIVEPYLLFYMRGSDKMEQLGRD